MYWDFDWMRVGRRHIFFFALLARLTLLMLGASFFGFSGSGMKFDLNAILVRGEPNHFFFAPPLA
jgi:hypothetical protein